MILMRILLAMVLVPFLVVPAQASDPSMASAAAYEKGELLVVELVVNGHPRDGFVELRRQGEDLWIAADSLRSVGIMVAERGPIAVTGRRDFIVEYDSPNQRLYLEVPGSLLPVSRVRGSARDRIAARSDPGAIFNYDLFVQRVDAQVTASLAAEQRAFAGPVVLSNTGVLRIGEGKTDYIRFDTRLIATDEERAIDLVAGDLVTHSLRWSRSVRMGGIGIARSFAVRPDLVTLPLPSFAGEVAVPSAVDLFVNGYRQAQADLTPGRFVLDQVPVVTGAGEARIVTTDAVGRQVETVIPFYLAPDLLRPGLVDFALEAGFLRRKYALADFSYGAAAASATVRRGMTDRLTLEAHSEASEALVSGGLGAIWSPGLWGALQGAIALSEGAGRSGHQVTLGYAYSGPGFGVGIERIERSAGFIDLGDTYRFQPEGRSVASRLSGSVVVPRFGSLAIGYFESRARDDDRVRLATASLSVPMRGGVSLFAAADRDFGSDATSMQIRLVAPLGKRGSARADISRLPGGRFRTGGGISRSVSTEGGIGFSADAALDDRGAFIGQASGLWRGRSVQTSAGVSKTAGTNSVWGSVSGSLALMDGHVFAANALPGSFALVSTGMPDVAVSYENQPVGRTDAGGRLFVPQVGAWQQGRFAIDPVDLDIGHQAKAVETRFAVRAGTGAIVHMLVTHIRSVIVRLVDGAGKPIAVGTTVRFDDGTQSVVGWDGIVVIEDAGERVGLEVRGVDGIVCRTHLDVPAEAEPYVDLGPVPCT